MFSLITKIYGIYDEIEISLCDGTDITILIINSKFLFMH